MKALILGFTVMVVLLLVSPIETILFLMLSSTIFTFYSLLTTWVLDIRDLKLK